MEAQRRQRDDDGEAEIQRQRDERRRQESEQETGEQRERWVEYVNGLHPLFHEKETGEEEFTRDVRIFRYLTAELENATRATTKWARGFASLGDQVFRNWKAEWEPVLRAGTPPMTPTQLHTLLTPLTRALPLQKSVLAATSRERQIRTPASVVTPIDPTTKNGREWWLAMERDQEWLVEATDLPTMPLEWTDHNTVALINMTFLLLADPRPLPPNSDSYAVAAPLRLMSVLDLYKVFTDVYRAIGDLDIVLKNVNTINANIMRTMIPQLETVLNSVPRKCFYTCPLPVAENGVNELLSNPYGYIWSAPQIGQTQADVEAEEKECFDQWRKEVRAAKDEFEEKFQILGMGLLVMRLLEWMIEVRRHLPGAAPARDEYIEGAEILSGSFSRARRRQVVGKEATAGLISQMVKREVLPQSVYNEILLHA